MIKDCFYCRNDLRPESGCSHVASRRLKTFNGSIPTEPTMPFLRAEDGRKPVRRPKRSDSLASNLLFLFRRKPIDDNKK